MTVWTRAVLLPIAVAALAACGGGNGAVEPTTSTTVPEVVSVNGTSYQERFALIDPTADFCVNAATLLERFTFAARADGHDDQLMQLLHDDILTVTVTAPEEIVDDLQLTANLLQDLNVAAGNLTDPDVTSLRDADGQLVTAERNLSEFTAAVTTIVDTVEQHCS